MLKDTWQPRPGFRRSLPRRVLLQAALRTLPGHGALVAGARRLWDQPDHLITLGRWSYFDGRPTVHAYPGAQGGRITVGAFCSIAKEVTFVLSGNHDAQRVTTSPVHHLLGGASFEDGEIGGRGGIRIGNDVWVGRGALVLDGAVIGDGAVVGARAVVSGAVEPYSTVVGSPARVVGRRFDEQTVDRLRRTAWWDLPDETLRAHLHLLGSRDVAAFLAAVEAL